MNNNTRAVPTQPAGVHTSSTANGLYFVALWDDNGNPNYAIMTSDISKAMHHAAKLAKLVKAVQ